MKRKLINFGKYEDETLYAINKSLHPKGHSVCVNVYTYSGGKLKALFDCVDMKVVFVVIHNRSLFPTRMGVFPPQLLLHFFYQEILARK